MRPTFDDSTLCCACGARAVSLDWNSGRDPTEPNDEMQVTWCESGCVVVSNLVGYKKVFDMIEDVIPPQESDE